MKRKRKPSRFLVAYVYIRKPKGQKKFCGYEWGSWLVLGGEGTGTEDSLYILYFGGIMKKTEKLNEIKKSGNFRYS